jgi:hypothetical protein
MPSVTSHGLDSSRRYGGQRAGRALIEWLNSRHARPSWLTRRRSYDQKYVEELLEDAKVVIGQLDKYGNLHKFRGASVAKEFSKFWDCRERLNRRLSTFTNAPWIDPHEFYEGNLISWTVTEDSPVAIVSAQINWVLDLINQRAVHKIRRCQQCRKWYFGRFSHQEFCSNLCRDKHHAGTEAFRERRRKYMRDYYRLKKSGKVK